MSEDEAAKVARVHAETEKLRIGVEAAVSLTGYAKDILVELLRASMTNPLCGFVGVIIVADILHQQKVISDLAFTTVIVSVAAVEATAVTASLSQDFASVVDSLNPFKSSPAPQSSVPMQPTASAITMAQGASAGQVGVSTLSDAQKAAAILTKAVPIA